MVNALERIADPEGFMLDPSLRLYVPLWKRDGNSFMSDDAYGHLCTVTGAPWKLQGRDFDGIDDYVDVSNPSIFALQKLTIRVWFGGTLTNTGALVSKKNSAIRWSYILKIREGKLMASVLYTDGSTSTDVASAVLPVGNHQGVLTYDGNWERLYLNGVLVNSAQIGAQTIPYAVENVQLGRSYYNGWTYAKCNLGEVDICSQALTAQEILDHYIETKWRYQ